jgi:hypothetical protein
VDVVAGPAHDSPPVLAHPGFDRLLVVFPALIGRSSYARAGDPSPPTDRVVTFCHFVI